MVPRIVLHTTNINNTYSYVYFVHIITNEMQGIRRTNEPDVSRRFHISWILTIQSIKLAADDVFYKKKQICYKDAPAVSTTVSGWYFDFSWYLGLDRSIFHLRHIYVEVYVNEFYVRGKVNTRTSYIRTSTFATFLFNSTKKHHYRN